MCGLSGIWNRERNPVERSLLDSFTNVVAHRGPDDSGYYFEDDFGLGLGHRRLSIIDLSSAAHQPMSSHDQQCWLVYNGEIYNYLELTAELIELGCHFRSHSDTEMILAAYQTWGYDCLNRFNGMFAFLLWDRSKQVLWAARDRFGIKPLYVFERSPNMIAFASEIKQFTVLPSWQAQSNPQRCYEFLAYGILDHTNETMFQNVWQLQGGQYLTLNCNPQAHDFGKTVVKQWYELPSSPTVTMSMDAAQQHFRELLQDSVRLRLRADVTVGSCLSGGLDSSSLVCVSDLLRRELSEAQPFQTFSSCFEDLRYDERKYVTTVVEQTQVQPHFVFPNAHEVFAQLDHLTWQQDEPFGSSSVFAQWCIFRQAGKSGIKVMLDGQGADELLAGYTKFYPALFAGLLTSYQWGTLIHEILTCQRYQNITEIQRMIEPLLPKWIRQSLRRLLGYASETATPNWLNGSYLMSLGVDPLVSATVAIATPKSIHELSKIQLRASSIPMLLHWEDRSSMAHSVESRVPFLDYQLVEFAYTLDDTLKIRQGQTKAILRESMRHILPESIRTRQDKMGFVTPELQWMRDGLRESFELELKEAITNLETWLQPNILQELFQATVAGNKNSPCVIWRVISFNRWLKVFNVQLS
ncbi:asparagine synthase (glutamine-hydrolyzing) [[Limnothrix rosea] IAM M-220]|uniref:asparagine synthase (glutamine-hydrolyzing) n=1 Tax=[Limnothrix rosea] IAM M-220 TaxID=454133 RepID=UPI00095DD78F|nr:asparagine synthase (glutamine-hydrolyzing) [[Limnothrix rosea] IAM M-220]OKH13841.1 asparagine synthase (glutamine-hydrolyzing) [[Limnothrix rosea] IAM M-220]